MKLGSHVGNSGLLMLKGSVLEALSYKATCFMVYMGAPQNTFRKPVHQMNVEDFKEILEGHDINIEDVIVHAPYIVNLGQIDEEKHMFGVRFLVDEIKKIEYNDIPEAFQGMPIVLVTAGLMAIAFCGFSGLL